ncbi:protein of unknown function [Xenorhabdus nematophila AN6/1]|nr:hypothetical protein XNA1_3150006 [Xenorhabdus nematophila str. Anatoliense]CEF33257.1 hypothetical protein XNW1_4700019 [Xenorhabdus nematophila str. Websteri]CEK24766.1 protein of unknown function [Xenorhabdus nematophila AN6/1]
MITAVAAFILSPFDDVLIGEQPIPIDADDYKSLGYEGQAPDLLVAVAWAGIVIEA